MASFKDYLKKKQLNEMGYMILKQPVMMKMGHNDEPVEIKMFDMRYEDYPAEWIATNRLSQWTPVVGKIPGTYRNYLVWDGTTALISKLNPVDLAETLKKEVKIGGKIFHYFMLPDEWYRYAVRVE